MTISIFNIIGPSMIGPSSSHTAGAVRIGLLAGQLLGSEFRCAKIELHGSFAATGKGHATDRALVAGLMGMRPDDERLKDARQLAQDNGHDVVFSEIDLGDDVHPNTTRIRLTDHHDQALTIQGSSIGGGSIEITQVDQFPTNFNGELPMIVIWHQDQPGFLAKIATLLACAEINIATLRTSRKSRNTVALTTIELDSELPNVFFKTIVAIESVHKCVCTTAVA